MLTEGRLVSESWCWVCVTQGFSQPLMVPRVRVCCLSICLLSLSSTSLSPPSAACDAGTYGTGGSCLPCPANSNSTQSGTSVCPCFEGYYRAAGDPPEMECTCKSYVQLLL